MGCRLNGAGVRATCYDGCLWRAPVLLSLGILGEFEFFRVCFAAASLWIFLLLRAPLRGSLRALCWLAAAFGILLCLGACLGRIRWTLLRLSFRGVLLLLLWASLCGSLLSLACGLLLPPGSLVRDIIGGSSAVTPSCPPFRYFDCPLRSRGLYLNGSEVGIMQILHH